MSPLELTQQLQAMLMGMDRAIATEAVCNVLVLLAVWHTLDRETAHNALEDECERMHECMEINYESAVQLAVVLERQGATVH